MASPNCYAGGGNRAQERATAVQGPVATFREHLERRYRRGVRQPCLILALWRFAATTLEFRGQGAALMQQDHFLDRQPAVAKHAGAELAKAGNGLGAELTCPGATPLPNPSSPWHLASAAAAVLFVALVFLVIPREVVGLNADSSWCTVLSYAQQKGWQFGTEIVFTYGPAGFLVTPWSTGHPFVVRLLSDITLTLLVAAGLCLAAWRVRLLCRLLLLGTLILLAPNIHLSADLLLYIGLLCWGALCLVESGGRLVMAVAVLACLAAFASLIKMNFLFAAALSIGAVTCDLALRERLRLALCLVLGFAASVALGWVLLGQNLSHFGSFLANGLAMCVAYNHGSAYHLPEVKMGGMIAATAALIMTVTGALTAFDSNDKRARWRRGLLLAWTGSLLFITWKHGFARGDRYHIGFFLIFIPALALALEALPREAPAGRAAVRGIGAFCCVICALTLQSAFFPAYLNFCARQPMRAISRNIRAILNTTEYWQALNWDL